MSAVLLRSPGWPLIECRWSLREYSDSVCHTGQPARWLLLCLRPATTGQPRRPVAPPIRHRPCIR
jgi:hypothetical protein